MGINLGCCIKCDSPSYFFMKPSGLVLCCGFTALDDLNDTTFGFHPGVINLYTGTNADFFETVDYDGTGNCDFTTVTGNSILHIEMALPLFNLPGFDRIVYTLYMRSDVVGADPFLSDVDWDNPRLGFPDDGGIFRFDSADAGVDPQDLLINNVFANWHEGPPICVWPDPIYVNFNVYGNYPVDEGVVVVNWICVLITFTSSSGTDGGGTYNAGDATVSAAAGSITINFTAIDENGDQGDWYATRGFYEPFNNQVYAIHGGGTAADALVFTTPTSGNGNDSVTIDYDANTTGNVILWKVFVNGSIFTLTQDP